MMPPLRRAKPLATIADRSKPSQRPPEPGTHSTRILLFAAGGAGFRCGRGAAVERGLLAGRQLEHVANEEIGFIARVIFRGGGQRAVEDPAIALANEKSGRHGRAGNDGGGLSDPALGPRSAEALAREQEIRRGGVLVMRDVAGHVALEARSSRTG